MSKDIQQIVAANVRARMGWYRISAPKLAARIGWPTRTLQSKVYDGVGITVDELKVLATALQARPGDLLEIPVGWEPPFTAEPESACTRLALAA